MRAFSAASVLDAQPLQEHRDVAGQRSFVLHAVTVDRVLEGQPHIVDQIIDGKIALIFNTTEGWQSLLDSKSIRATALEKKVPYYTTAAASRAAAAAIAAIKPAQLEVRSLQDYYS